MCTQWLIQGRDPPLVLDQTEARRAEKNFIEMSLKNAKSLTC